jgi:hypothetical protein
MSVVAKEANVVRIDIDGEQPGILPLDVSVIPKGLLVSAF